MFRFSCLLLLFCAAPCLAFAQAGRTTMLNSYYQLDSLAEVAKGENNVAQVIELSKQMLDMGRRLSADSLIMNAQLLHGQALAYFGIFDAALNTYYELLSLAEQSENCYYRVKTATLIGGIHQNMADWNKSQEFLALAKQSAISCGMLTDTLLINYSVARNMLQMGHAEAGIQLTGQNLSVSRQAGIYDGMLYGINELSDMLAMDGQFDKAMKVGLEVFNLPQNQLNDLDLAQIYQRLAQIAVELKDFKSAQKYKDEAFRLATRIGLHDHIYECYRTQSDIDIAQGKFERALENFVQYSNLKDSVYQHEYDTKMSAMIALYDLESKQKTIALLKTDKQLQESKIQQQKVLMLLGLLSLLLLIFGIAFYNQRKINQLRTAFAQDLIHAQEQERQRISRELHDSVGQNILFVKNRLQRLLPAPETALFNSVEAALAEVRNIAKNLYPNQLEQYGLSSSVDTLCALVQESSGIFVSSDLTGIDERLNRDAKINCYRIIQECINNALKHAEATAIRITSNNYPDKVELVVQDNGKGFESSILERKAVRSFGILNMSERIKMLRGKFDLESNAEKGSKFTFSIPV